MKPGRTDSRANRNNHSVWIACEIPPPGAYVETLVPRQWHCFWKVVELWEIGVWLEKVGLWGDGLRVYSLTLLLFLSLLLAADL